MAPKGFLGSESLPFSVIFTVSGVESFTLGQGRNFLQPYLDPALKVLAGMECKCGCSVLLFSEGEKLEEIHQNEEEI